MKVNCPVEYEESELTSDAQGKKPSGLFFSIGVTDISFARERESIAQMAWKNICASTS